MRYMAIDYGRKRTGLAVCDRDETLASPLTVLEGQKNLLQRILEVVREENIDAIVVGLPVNMDGSKGPQARLVEEFAGRLCSLVDIPVQFHDERLTTFAAREKLAPVGMGGRKKGKFVDAVAAAEILESFLEQKRQSK